MVKLCVKDNQRNAFLLNVFRAFWHFFYIIRFLLTLYLLNTYTLNLPGQGIFISWQTYDFF